MAQRICPVKVNNPKWDELTKKIKEKFPDAEEAEVNILAENAFFNHFATTETGEIPSIQEAIAYLSPETPSRVSGLSKAFQAERAAELGISPAERLAGVTAEEAVNKGRELTARGADADKIAEDYKSTKKVSIDDIYVLFSKADQLMRETDVAADKYGTSSEEYIKALDKEQSWKRDIINPIANEFFHQVGKRLQAAVDIDTGTYAGLQRAYRERTGYDFNEKQKIEAEGLIKNVESAKKEVADAANKLTDLINKEAEKSKASAPKGDIHTKYADREGLDFNPKEVKEIWEYAKKEYIDQDATFEDTINGVAKDLGLNSRQVVEIFTKPKGARTITNEMYRRQERRRRAISNAREFIRVADSPKILRFINSLPNRFFGFATFGHGTVGGVTHAATQIFRPTQWKKYWPFFFKQFKFAYLESETKYAKAMADLQADPDFTFWKRAGLAVDPTKQYSEYEGMKKYFGRLGGAGDRGFNALKVYRLDLAKSYWEGLSNVEKADTNTANKIAEIVNNSTGATSVSLGKAGKYLSTAFFAPKLEISRWKGLITNPVRALNTYANWSTAKPAEKAAAKIVAKNAGEILATYMSALAANAGLMAAIGSKEKVNFTDPTKADWLKFKIGNRSIDMTGGMISTMKFVYNMMQNFLATYIGEKERSRLTTGEKALSLVGTQLRYKLSPFAGTVIDLAIGTDPLGRPIPFSKEKPRKGEKRYTVGEYLISKGPIPFAEAFREVVQSMRDKGMDNAQISDILNGIMVFGVTGLTGVKVQEIKERPKSTSRKKRTVGQ